MYDKTGKWVEGQHVLGLTTEELLLKAHQEVVSAREGLEVVESAIRRILNERKKD